MRTRLSMFIGLVITMFLLSGCTRPCDNPGEPRCVTVPTSDGSPPTVSMVVGDDYAVFIDVNETSQPLTMVAGSDKLSIVASGRDDDGGLKAVRLWATYTYYGGGQSLGPSLPGAPVDEAVSTAQIGENTLKHRLLAHTFELDTALGTWSRLELDIWVEGENFHGGIELTPMVTVHYPARQAGDTPYMAECRRRNVPIPPNWQASGSAWQLQGNLTTNLGHPGDDAFIWTYADDELRGACIAIARENGAGGFICQSAITGSACFWDNIRRSDGARLPYPQHTTLVITEIEDGSNVAENCTECHRGNNVFLMSPDDLVWAQVMRGPLATSPGSMFTTRVEWSRDELGGHPRYIPITLVSRPPWENPDGAGGCAGPCHENPSFAQSFATPPMPPACAAGGTVEDCYR